jgi:hypothetical protein
MKDDRDRGCLDDVLDAAQAAAILGVTRQHIVHLCKTGRLPSRRLTACWITTRQAVEAYAQDRRGPGRPRGGQKIIDDDRHTIKTVDEQD